MSFLTPRLDGNALRGVRVLIVDDEPVLATTFCLVLKMTGALATSAGHGGEALTLLERQRFDVIVCDKQMPVMSGPEFVRELNRRGDPTPILLFVNTADTTGMEQVWDLRIHGTISKPLLPAELVSVIRRTLHMDAVAV